MGYVDRHGGYHEDALSLARANAQYDQAEALTKLAKQAEESRREARKARNAEQQERSLQLARQAAQQEREAEQRRVAALMQTPEGREQLKREAEQKKEDKKVNWMIFRWVVILFGLGYIIPFDGIIGAILIFISSVVLAVFLSEDGLSLIRHWIKKKASDYKGNKETAGGRPTIKNN